MKNSPSSYRAIAVWHASSSPCFVARLQKRASDEDAPLDAIFRSESGWRRVSSLPPGHWFHGSLASRGVHVALDPAVQLAVADAHVTELRSNLLRHFEAALIELRAAEATAETLRAMHEDKG